MDVMAKGVAIVSVSTGIAANYGFQPGDIVRSVNGAAINRVGDLVRALNGANRLGHGDRAGRPQDVAVRGRLDALAFAGIGVTAR